MSDAQSSEWIALRTTIGPALERFERIHVKRTMVRDIKNDFDGGGKSGPPSRVARRRLVPWGGSAFFRERDLNEFAQLRAPISL
jgi:hypothetical protein